MKATDTIRSLQHPTNLYGLGSFLFFCSVLKRLDPNFTHISAPLESSLEKDQRSHFVRKDESEIEALETLQHRLLSPPTLSIPGQNGRYALDTNANETQFRCYLLHERIEGPEKFVEYWSRSIHKAKQAYDPTHRESLAVVWTVILLRPNLVGFWFIIRRDHEAL